MWGVAVQWSDPWTRNGKYWFYVVLPDTVLFLNHVSPHQIIYFRPSGIRVIFLNEFRLSSVTDDCETITSNVVDVSGLSPAVRALNNGDVCLSALSTRRLPGSGREVNSQKHLFIFSLARIHGDGLLWIKSWTSQHRMDVLHVRINWHQRQLTTFLSDLITLWGPQKKMRTLKERHHIWYKQKLKQPI